MGRALGVQRSGITHITADSFTTRSFIVSRLLLLVTTSLGAATPMELWWDWNVELARQVRDICCKPTHVSLWPFFRMCQATYEG
ncbi:hypothetical protein F4604DRAFT_1806908 [Suillus subluteus]|nr:hypothetical protein F4604DRAFT_1806908 [Suillus subluteus]